MATHAWSSLDGVSVRETALKVTDFLVATLVATPFV